MEHVLQLFQSDAALLWLILNSNTTNNEQGKCLKDPECSSCMSHGPRRASESCRADALLHKMSLFAQIWSEILIVLEVK